MSYETLENNLKVFIDLYLDTMNMEKSAIRSGIAKNTNEAKRIVMALLSEEEIQKAIDERKKELNNIAVNQSFTKEDLIRVFWSMYNEALNKGKIKEAKEILEDIAKWNGVEPNKVSNQIAQINCNLKYDKI